VKECINFVSWKDRAIPHHLTHVQYWLPMQQISQDVDRNLGAKSRRRSLATLSIHAQSPIYKKNPVGKFSMAHLLHLLPDVPTSTSDIFGAPLAESELGSPARPSRKQGRSFTPPSPPWAHWAAGVGWMRSNGSKLATGPHGSVVGGGRVYRYS
jgi:hypothetical protein